MTLRQAIQAQDFKKVESLINSGQGENLSSLVEFAREEYIKLHRIDANELKQGVNASLVQIIDFLTSLEKASRDLDACFESRAKRKIANGKLDTFVRLVSQHQDYLSRDQLCDMGFALLNADRAQDEKLSSQLIQRAATLDVPEAMGQLARDYLWGRGRPEKDNNPLQAIDWYQRAIALGQTDYIDDINDPSLRETKNNDLRYAINLLSGQIYFKRHFKHAAKERLDEAKKALKELRSIPVGAALFFETCDQLFSNLAEQKIDEKFSTVITEVEAAEKKESSVLNRQLLLFARDLKNSVEKKLEEKKEEKKEKEERVAPAPSKTQLDYSEMRLVAEWYQVFIARLNRHPFLSCVNPDGVIFWGCQDASHRNKIRQPLIKNLILEKYYVDVDRGNYGKLYDDMSWLDTDTFRYELRKDFSLPERAFLAILAASEQKSNEAKAALLQKYITDEKLGIEINDYSYNSLIKETQYEALEQAYKFLASSSTESKEVKEKERIQIQKQRVSILLSLGNLCMPRISHGNYPDYLSSSPDADTLEIRLQKLCFLPRSNSSADLEACATSNFIHTHPYQGKRVRGWIEEIQDIKRRDPKTDPLARFMLARIEEHCGQTQTAQGMFSELSKEHFVLAVIHQAAYHIEQKEKGRAIWMNTKLLVMKKLKLIPEGKYEKELKKAEQYLKDIPNISTTPAIREMAAESLTFLSQMHVVEEKQQQPFDPDAVILAGVKQSRAKYEAEMKANPYNFSVKPELITAVNLSGMFATAEQGRLVGAIELKAAGNGYSHALLPPPPAAAAAAATSSAPAPTPAPVTR